MATAATEMDDDISEAFEDALTENDGMPSAPYLRLHLAKRGLLIVDAAKYRQAKVALQLSASGLASAIEKMES